VTKLKRGMIIHVDLNPTRGLETGKIRPCVIVTNDVYNARVPVIQVVPITSWSQKKSLIRTNVEINQTSQNGLDKKSIVDCLQTRPIDRRVRMVGIRGELEADILGLIDESLRIVFDLS